MRRYSSKAAFALAKAPAKSFPLKAPPLKYTTTTVASVNNLQLAAVDDSSSPISSLALVLPTGPRHQVSESEQGVAQWLKHAAFKSTNTKSTLAIAREAEILGHRLTAALGREELVLAADFRRDDLPDVVALFANILRGFTERDNAPWGIYTREQVRKSKEWAIAGEQAEAETKDASSVALVLDDLHRVAFRNGLGQPLYSKHKTQNLDSVLGFIDRQFKSGQLKLVGYGVDAEDLQKAVEVHFASVQFSPSSSASSETQKYYGGEHFEEVDSDEVVYTLAFNAAPLNNADYFTGLVLKELLGSSADGRVKYGTNHSLLGQSVGAVEGAKSDALTLSYSDAGLFGFVVTGDNTKSVNEALAKSVDALKKVAKGSLEEGVVAGAVEGAKLSLASQYETEDRLNKLSALSLHLKGGKKLYDTKDLIQKVGAVTPKALSSFASNLLKSKPSVAARGSLYGLFHADQLNLK